jgi:hypothetical protein
MEEYYSFFWDGKKKKKILSPFYEVSYSVCQLRKSIRNSVLVIGTYLSRSFTILAKYAFTNEACLCTISRQTDLQVTA